MADMFSMLRENDLIWSFVVNNYLLGREPPPFDLLYWNSDSTRLPATMLVWYLRRLYQENKLIEPGGIRTDFVRRSAEWTHHPDYADQIATARSMAITLLDNAPDPAEVARVVHRAATDRSERLRYLAKPGPYVTLNRMLPDALWRRMIQTALSRASRADGLPAKTDASTQK